MSFTVAVLAYGDHPALLDRCLSSLAQRADWSHVAEVRLGFNAVSEATRQTALKWAAELPVKVLAFEPTDRQNVCKYPLMRRMLYEPGYEVQTPHFMWFDDDSYLKSSGVLTACHEMLTRDYAVIGRPYRLQAGYRGDQPQWIARQKWFNRRVVRTRDPAVTWFPQGAWWAAKTAVLKEWDWPSPELRHRGGDVLFGALIHQQQLPWSRWDSDTVGINADETGKASSSPRRGMNEQPLGIKDRPADPAIHQFVVGVTRLPSDTPVCEAMPASTLLHPYPITRLRR